MPEPQKAPKKEEKYTKKPLAAVSKINNSKKIIQKSPRQRKCVVFQTLLKLSWRSRTRIFSKYEAFPRINWKSFETPL